MIQHELIGQTPFIGALNEHIFVSTDHNLALLRSPKINKDLFHSIYFEYNFMGFIEDGGRFRRRTPRDQFLLTQNAALLGLRVNPPLALAGDAIIYPFLMGAKTIDEYLPCAPPERRDLIVFQLIEDLYKAHLFGLVYGDRWSQNMLIDPKFGLTHIDFDLEIEGPSAREFEISQVAYYTLSAGRETVLSTLAGILNTHSKWFDGKKVEKYMRKHAIYFNNTRYGGIQNQTEDFLKLLNH